MKWLIFIFQVFLCLNLSGQGMFSPDGFKFEDSSTWGGEFGIMIDEDDYNQLTEDGVYPLIIPSYYKIENDNISYIFGRSNTEKSWYTTEFHYNKDLDGYEFSIIGLGGVIREARILREGNSYHFYYSISFHEDTGWVYINDIYFPKINYSP